MEERTIKISLDKAKEYYNKGGELKEIALLAFKEDELKEKKLPNTWEEYCKNPDENTYYYINDFSNICSWSTDGEINSREEKYFLPSKEATEAHLALMQLHLLRDCYRQGWKPDWNDSTKRKYCIIVAENEIIPIDILRTQYFLSFQTEKLRGKFLNNFKDLIIKAKELL